MWIPQVWSLILNKKVLKRKVHSALLVCPGSHRKNQTGLSELFQSPMTKELSLLGLSCGSLEQPSWKAVCIWLGSEFGAKSFSQSTLRQLRLWTTGGANSRLAKELPRKSWSTRRPPGPWKAGHLEATCLGRWRHCPKLGPTRERAATEGCTWQQAK